MTIAQEVFRIINSDLSLQKEMSRGLINQRALARYILDNYNLKASMDAVISALRRVEVEPVQEFEKKVSNLFRGAVISTKNNLVCFTLKSDAITQIPKGLAKKIKIVTGTEEIKFIVDKGQSEILEDNLSDFIIREEKDIGEITIKLAEEAAKTRGVLLKIANEIVLNKINIIELLISVPEFLIYVKEKDVIKTHEVLLNLCE